jgi:hypothetical protein
MKLPGNRSEKLITSVHAGARGSDHEKRPTTLRRPQITKSTRYGQKEP